MAVGGVSGRHARLALRAGRIGIWDWDVQSGKVEFTEDMPELHGIVRAQAPRTAREWLRIVAAEDRSRLLDALRVMLAGADECEIAVRVVTPVGPVLWKRITAEVIRDQGRPVRVVGASVDITEWRDAEDKHQRAAIELEQVLSSSAAILTRSGPDGISYVSPNVRPLLGHAPSALSGSGWRSLVHADDRSLLEHALGTPNREEVQALVRVRGGDGVWRWFDVLATPHDDQGGVVVACWIDVTARRALERRLQQASRLEGLGRLAAGVAHDFNNLLASMRGYCELMQDAAGDPDAVLEQLGELSSVAARGEQMVQQLLALGRRGSVPPVPIDAAAVVRGLEPMMRQLLPPDVELRAATPRYCPKTVLGPGQLDRAVLNLVTNARDAMPGGGRIEVRVDPVRASHAQQLTSADRQVRLRVRDDGPGIAPEHVPQLCEPFYTTKPDGTGLGLAIVSAIATEADGALDIRSVVGEGTTVDLYLPVAEDLATVDKPPARGPRAVAPTRILIVEDEPAIRDVLSRALTPAGYEVLTAGSGEAALVALDDLDDGVIDALVTDVMLPGMSGVALAESARRTRPGLPVLFLSGHPPASPQQPATHAPQAFLAKPFGLQELRQSLHRLLAAVPV